MHVPGEGQFSGGPLVGLQNSGEEMSEGRDFFPVMYYIFDFACHVSDCFNVRLKPRPTFALQRDCGLSC